MDTSLKNNLICNFLKNYKTIAMSFCVVLIKIIFLTSLKNNFNN